MNLGPGGLALEGHDPVAYVEQQRAVPGRPELSLPYRGATYLFSTPAHREMFARDPKRWLPAYGGWCATAMAEGRRVGVDPGSFLVSGGRLLLFYRSRGWDAKATWQAGDTAALEKAADAWWDRVRGGGLGRTARAVSWALQIVTAAILFQTLFFKFTSAPESVWIFTTLGMEPWGRIGSGVAELIACVLLLVPRTIVPGAILSLGVISGAIVSHLTRLGIVVQDDGGLLFALALAVFAASAAVVAIRRAEIPLVGRRLFAAPGGAAALRGARSAGGAMACQAAPVDDGRRRVLVLGGGFGGVYAALELEKRLGRDDVEVTLVNRENFFLFTPMLHEVAASDLDLTNIVSPVRQMLRRVRFFQGDVEGIDLPGRRVTLSHGSDRHTHDVPYDQLVIALGSVTNFHDIPGLADQALTIRSLGDAMALRNRLIACLEEADTECAGASREALLTFVVAGGGFAGVETIASLNDFVREALRYYPSLSVEDLRVVLVHSGPRILPELGEDLGEYARRKLAARGVEIHTGRRVAGLEADAVRFGDGLSIPTRTLIWTAGTSPHPLLDTLPCRRDRGRIVVDEMLQVPGFPGVWALGDCALVPDALTGKPCPPTAQHALREGRTAARNILASLDGAPLRPFRFATLGQLATIGRRAGVARVFGFTFSGFSAWWLWRTIYLSKLPRAEKKLRVALDWTLDLFFSKDLVQFLTARAPAMTGGVPVSASGDPARAAAGPAEGNPEPAALAEVRR
jgi:NADH dehydrogenase